MTEKNKNDLTDELVHEKLETPIKSIAEENTDFEKKIEQYINKKIRRIIVKTGLAVFLVLIILFFVISPVMDALYLNPYKLQKDQTFFSVMRDYYDVTRPYIEINNIQAEKKGFGRYELGISATDNAKKREIGIENVWVDLERGKYKNWEDPERLLIAKLGEFENPKTKEEMKACYENAKTLKKLQTKAYYISGKRDDILEFVKKTDMKTVNVYQVKSNMWE